MDTTGLKKATKEIPYPSFGKVSKNRTTEGEQRGQEEGRGGRAGVPVLKGTRKGSLPMNKGNTSPHEVPEGDLLRERKRAKI